MRRSRASRSCNGALRAPKRDRCGLAKWTSANFVPRLNAGDLCREPWQTLETAKLSGLRRVRFSPSL